MQICICRLLAIAGGQRRVREAQPDRRHVDGGLIENVLVDVRGGVEISERMSRLGFAERRRFSDKARCVFQARESASRRLEAAQSELRYTGVVRRMRAQWRLRRRRRGKPAECL